jgi:endonuclease/exonuclease/phosphatase family metal-dependent hydrolase
MPLFSRSIFFGVRRMVRREPAMTWTAEPRRVADGYGMREPSKRMVAELTLAAPMIRLAKRGLRQILALGRERNHQPNCCQGGRGAWLALLMVVAGCSPHVQQPPVGVPVGTPETQATAPGNPVRDYVVATWNVAWATTRNNKFPRDSATWQRTRDFAIALGADIVALQEVDGKPIAEFLLPPSAGFGDWRTTNTDAPSEEQRVVIVTRAGIPVQGHTDLSSIGGGGLRAGLDSTVMLDAKPLRVLVLHLKAECNRRTLPPLPSNGEDHCSKLARQIPHVAAWIAARRLEGGAYMVIGDFNRELGRSGDQVWAAFRQADPDLRRIEQRETGNCGAGNGGIDNILLGGAAARWEVAGSQRGIPLPAPGGAIGRLSDHCPLLITLRPH